jgi:hypothetical protein
MRKVVVCLTFLAAGAAGGGSGAGAGAAWAQEPPPAPTVEEGPGQGAYEVGLSGQFGRFFGSEVTALDLGVGLGYFLSDTLELTLSVGIGYTTEEVREASTLDPIGSGAVVAAIPTSLEGGGGWSTSIGVGARWFLPGRRASATSLAPFVGLEAGGLLVEDIDPFLAASASVGARLPLGTRAAFTPQAGYVFLYATDDNVRFGGEKTEHALAAWWSLSVFF